MSTSINQNVKISKGREVCWFLFITIFPGPRGSPNTQEVFNLDTQMIDTYVHTYIGRQIALAPNHHARLSPGIENDL